MTPLALVKPKAGTNRMEDVELKQRFEEIKNRKPDPDSARLFLEARNRGRTAEEIKAVTGKSVSMVKYLFVFGEWLSWFDKLKNENATIVANANFKPHELKEGTFRKFWNANSELSLQERRKATLADLIEHQKERERHNNQKHKPLVAAIKASGLIDGKKHKISHITKKVGFDKDYVMDFLVRRQGSTVHGFQAERVNDSFFKLHKAKAKKVRADVLLSQIEPMLEELDAMGKFILGSHKIVPSKIRNLVFDIRKQFEALID